MSGKKPDIALILSVAAASAIVAGVIVFVSLRQQAPVTQPAGAPLSVMGEQIDIPDLLQICQKGDTCIVVDRTCSFCCKYTAINAAHEKLYDEMFNASCGSYKGAVCECFDLSSYPSCVNGKCQLVKFDEQKFEVKQQKPQQEPPARAEKPVVRKESSIHDPIGTGNSVPVEILKKEPADIPAEIPLAPEDDGQPHPAL